MRIAFIGRFRRLYDEEYIARSFEAIGHTVMRLDSGLQLAGIWQEILTQRPDIVLFTKFPSEIGVMPQPGTNDECLQFIDLCRSNGIKTVSWVFDLYFGYYRESLVYSRAFFKADYVFTTDDGHTEEFKKAGVNHQCVRQGIMPAECKLEPYSDPAGIVFVGGDNPNNQERGDTIGYIKVRYPDLQWYGRENTNEIRGMALNELYARTQIVVGDSVYSPHYWSNRVVETLGRGGFLIHQEVPGLSEEYPYLVTYKRGDMTDLYRKINYYREHEGERRKLVEQNFHFVRGHYTMDHKCAELISKL